MNRRNFFQAMSALVLSAVFGRKPVEMTTPLSHSWDIRDGTIKLADESFTIAAHVRQSPDEIFALVKEEMIRILEVTP